LLNHWSFRSNTLLHTLTSAAHLFVAVYLIFSFIHIVFNCEGHERSLRWGSSVSVDVIVNSKNLGSLSCRVSSRVQGINVLLRIRDSIFYLVSHNLFFFAIEILEHVFDLLLTLLVIILNHID
jgi:hypothetical protein